MKKLPKWSTFNVDQRASLYASLIQKIAHATISRMEKELKLYEVSYLINPALSEEDARNFQQEIKSTLQSLGGLIDSDGGVIKKRLSYPIKKVTECWLAHFKFMLEAGKIAEFKKELESKNALRCLLIETKRIRQQFVRPRRIPLGAQTKPAATNEPQSTAQARSSQPDTTVPSVPSMNIEEIDKRLEEILGPTNESV